MDIFSIIIIAIGLAMDSFAVCISKGMCMRELYPWRTIKIALVFGAFQAFMPLVGYLLGLGFLAYIAQYDHWLAFVILLLLGAKMIYESVTDDTPQTCETCSCSTAESVNWKQICTLAFATSIDAMATGFIFVPFPELLLVAVLSIGLVTLFFAYSGMFIGKRLGKRLHFNMEVLGGAVLILIGTKILVEHLIAEGAFA